MPDSTLPKPTVPDLADPQFIETGEGPQRRSLAVRARQGASPGIFWLSGFMSDMKGTKAAALDEWAAREGRACVRFDYSGHGESGGPFTEGTIGRWLEDSLSVFDRVCRGPQIVVGSSMGGWIALLLARALQRRRSAGSNASIAGMVLIAPAADFTEELMWKRMPDDIRAQLVRDGTWLRPSQYDDSPYPITMRLIEEGRNHLVLNASIKTDCPVRILQGAQDPDVPWQHAVALASRLPADDVLLTLIPDGDHRLSRPQDIGRLIAAVTALS